MEKMFGQELLFDPVVKHVIDKGIKVSRLTDLEKRAQEVDTAGYLANDNMIVENLGDHADAEVAKGAKQAAENCIKKRLEEIKCRSIEETSHVPLSQKKAFDQEGIGYAKLLEEAMEAAEKYKGYNNDQEKASANEEPLQMLQKENSKKAAFASNTSVKEGSIAKMRKESAKKKCEKKKKTKRK